jgi:hypothetical protein
MPEPPPAPPPAGRLVRLAKEDPEAHRRISRAVAGLLGASIVAIAAVGALLIWHLVRRGRMIRDGLAPPRAVRLPEEEEGDDPPMTPMDAD